MDNQYFVYVLRSLKDNQLYVGFTRNIERRFQEHLAGLTPSTKHRRPLELIYYERYTNKVDVMQREKYLKSGFGKKYIQRVLENTLKSL